MEGDVLQCKVAEGGYASMFGVCGLGSGMQGTCDFEQVVGGWGPGGWQAWD